jgi:hypothetical protein
MAGYRLYRLDDGNHITERFDFDAADDAAAIEIARSACAGSFWEVWELGRKVGCAPAQTRQAA